MNFFANLIQFCHLLTKEASILESVQKLKDIAWYWCGSRSENERGILTPHFSDCTLPTQLGEQTAGWPVPALSYLFGSVFEASTSCLVTLNKLLNFSKLLFPPLQRWYQYSLTWELLRGLNEIVQIKSLGTHSKPAILSGMGKKTKERDGISWMVYILGWTQWSEPTVSQGLFQFYNSPFLSFSWPFSDFSEYFLLLTTISNFVFINF